MRFIVDENLPPSVAEFLRSKRHDVLYVAEILRSFEDASILKIAFREKRILITKDKGFGGLIFKKKFPHSGIILLRLTNDSAQNTIRVLEKLFSDHFEDLRNSFLVADESNVRIIPPKKEGSL